jgi:tetratricopeptide (TPR) repeat protein
LETRLAQEPPDLGAGRLLAEGYLAQRRDAAAIRTLRRIVAHAPGDRQALMQLEATYTRAGNYKSAIAVLEKLVEADPRRAQEYYERMAHAASLQTDRKGALHFAELAVQTSPNDPAAQAKLGDLYLEQGRPDAAEAAYRKALAQDDRLHLVGLRLSELLAKTKRAPEALDLLFHVLRTAREHDTIRRATRRSLSLSVPLGQTRRVEDILRPLAIGRPEQPLYRSLLLEVLSAQMYPLLLSASHGSDDDRSVAEQKLRELSDRSTGPLLAALSDDNKGEQQTAISLLAHGGTNRCPMRG